MNKNNKISPVKSILFSPLILFKMSRSGTKIYVGHISERTRTRDIEHIFGRYGKIKDLDIKSRFAFITY